MPFPVQGMQHEAAARFYWPATQHRQVRHIGRVDVKAFEKLMQPDTLDFIADRDAERAIFIMDANGDHGMVEAHVLHARQGEQELTGIGAKLIHGPEYTLPSSFANGGLSFVGGDAARSRVLTQSPPAPTSRPINGRRQLMTIAKGDRIPTTSFAKMTENGPEQVSSDEFFKGRTIALFSVPGAFTPTCSAKHLPGFVEKADALKEKGVDEIACTAVNDAFVMGAWGKSAGADEKVTMLADGNGDFVKAAGLTMDGSKFGMGTRGQRFSMIVKDGVVAELNVEAPGEFKISSADHLLEQL